MAGNQSSIAVGQLVAEIAARCSICSEAMENLWPSNNHCYFRCPKCEFVSVAPVPGTDVLRDYYAKAYIVDFEGYRGNIRRHGLNDIKLLEDIAGPGRLLEIGSSWGLFLEAARRRGWQVRGIEISDTAAKWAKEKLRLEVDCGTIEDFVSRADATFDVVVAWHVIEHVQNPIAFLRIVRESLRPGGVLALRTPNIRSLPARINGWAWQWVGAPAHLSLFSTKALTLAAEKTGFSVLRSSTRRGDAHNLLFEILRGSARKVNLHHQIKRLLRIQQSCKELPKSVVDPQAADQRVKVLSRLNRLFDRMLIPFYPIEKLLDFVGLGPELFFVAVRL